MVQLIGMKAVEIGGNKEETIMRKKFLLTIIPALMVLSACAGAQPRQEAVQQEPEFVEDTLAHEEIFGEAGRQIKLTPYKDPVVPSDPSLRKPLVGVQYKDEGGGKYAVRYVAAIAALDVEATWTRGICDKAGVQKQTGDNKFVNKVVEYAYTAVSADSGSGDAYTTPEAVNENFHYFVVYTLRNVPADQLNSYLFAYLTLTKGVESVKSLARVSKISGGNTFTYDTDSGTGYFIQGTINGVANSVLPINDTPTGTNYAQEENFTLAANDTFGLFKYASDHFQCFGYDQLRRGAQFLPKVTDSNYIKASGAGSYSLYLTNSNEIHIVAPDAAKASTKLYFKPGDDWTSYAARYALYVFNDSTSTNDWFDLTQVGSTGIYTCDAFSAVTWPNCIFCRMNPGNSTNDWGQKWSQTENLSTGDVGNIFYVNNDSGTGDGCKGNWNLYLA